MEILPTPPKLFFCKKCKVYFYSFSKLKNPTHPTCTTHQTEESDKYTVKTVELINKIVITQKKKLGCL